MDFRDFQKYFDTVDICNLTPDSPIDMPRQWHTTEFHGRWLKGFSAGGRPTLRGKPTVRAKYFGKVTDSNFRIALYLITSCIYSCNLRVS